MPIFVETGLRTNSGMAGNVLENLRSLSPGIDVVALFSTSGSKARYVDVKSGHHLLRVDVDQPVSPLTVETLGAIWKPFDAVIVSDYAKGYLDESILMEIRCRCFVDSIPLFIDTKRLLSGWAEHAIVKINEAEFLHQLKKITAPWSKCLHLIVTMGGDGMKLISRTGADAHHVPAIPIQVRDGAGCGDTVLAALVVRYLENGGDLKDAMQWAGKAGAVAVSKRGVVAVKREEVQ